MDTETTGTSPTRDRIIEIGIVRVEDGKITEEFESLIDPQMYLPPEITNLTGINAFELESAPTFRTVKEKIDDLKQDFSLLIEAGFVAVKQLDPICSSRLFIAAQMISPKHTAPQIGLGYIALNQLNVKEATTIFEEVTKKEPKNLLAQTFLGICYLLSKLKRKKGEQLIQDAMKNTPDPTIKSLGELSLKWADRDLQKKKAPFFEAPVKKDT
ncbi:MAG: exonuclease domain-containing protein [Candidatus Paceibacterales bacterium]